MMNSAIGRLRVIGIVEGISFLLLLGVAMPLKYLGGIPMAVKIVGWAHGVLFVLFCSALAHAFFAARWSMFRGASVFFAALVPFGPFAIDGWLKREEQRLRGPDAPPAEA
ncbi:DUF3817 domain-containing protein [Chondromyces crocatus]|uniref:Membrane protein n=1 Tax=Chondromyces crocatus TaxID=52 RepID=A0A0K1ENU7_CHOCO|nr:DUF3817 domain-containing protein [Chondromyces crocatus]AKT42565.1 membrane protein [Chondromyces crocatus]